MVKRSGSLEDMVESFWKNKKVFLTGHTGFKGSWMSLWLLKAGANLTGYSLGLPSTPSLFEELKISKDMNSIFADIRDLENLKREVKEAQPEIIIHMAAQPLVRYSYAEPVETYMTNVMGTVHLFEAARKAESVKAVLNVTSDKCYENLEREEGYKEHEAMGGNDPYSNSKGCAELVTHAYRQSFFKKEGLLLASGRAGNVIGGGDWADDRLVPDIIRSVIKNETLVIRSPKSVRPWQHVLEPVGGYLHLAEMLYNGGEKYAEGFNFGPSKEDHCEWQPRWNLNLALQKTVEWNEQRLIDLSSVKDVTLKQISEYQQS
ncbi:MAG: rfbG [Pseudobdellovibrio sp.]|nr:rfbG [Pseudobdellovibrio sp.]